MKKAGKVTALLLVLSCLVWLGSLLAQKRQLGDGVIRLHVVADSDREADQRVKEMVRDAVLAEVEPVLETLNSKEEALAWLAGHTDRLAAVADQVLEAEGFSQRARVGVAKEAFGTRQYDTFSLPAGVYDALRITIGSGEGRNWWCVLFPGLCMPAQGETFEDQAAGAGFSDTLTGALEQRQGYEVRFFLLDCLGWLENFFFRK